MDSMDLRMRTAQYELDDASEGFDLGDLDADGHVDVVARSLGDFGAVVLFGRSAGFSKRNWAIRLKKSLHLIVLGRSSRPQHHWMIPMLLAASSALVLCVVQQQPANGDLRERVTATVEAANQLVSHEFRVTMFDVEYGCALGRSLVDHAKGNCSAERRSRQRSSDLAHRMRRHRPSSHRRARARHDSHSSHRRAATAGSKSPSTMTVS